MITYTEFIEILTVFKEEFLRDRELIFIFDNLPISFRALWIYSHLPGESVKNIEDFLIDYDKSKNVLTTYINITQLLELLKEDEKEFLTTTDKENLLPYQIGFRDCLKVVYERAKELETYKFIIDNNFADKYNKKIEDKNLQNNIPIQKKEKYKLKIYHYPIGIAILMIILSCVILITTKSYTIPIISFFLALFSFVFGKNLKNYYILLQSLKNRTNNNNNG